MFSLERDKLVKRTAWLGDNNFLSSCRPFNQSGENSLRIFSNGKEALPSAISFQLLFCEPWLQKYRPFHGPLRVCACVVEHRPKKNVPHFSLNQIRL